VIAQAMKTTHRFASLLIASTASFIASAAFAQSPDVGVPGDATTKTAITDEVLDAPADGARLSFIDRRMATFLAVDTQIGIDMATWAGTHAQDERVKQLAGRLASEWTSLLAVLDARTDGKATAEMRENMANRESGETKLAVPAKRSIRNMLNVDKTLMRMKLEIAADSCTSLRSQIESRPAAEIDRLYVGSEVFRQVQTLSTLKVLRRYGSSALAPILDDAIGLSERQLADTLATLAALAAPELPPMPVASAE
jgi:hypothetical protein